MGMTAQATGSGPRTGVRIDAAKEWASFLTGLTGALLLFGSITGLTIYLLPFSDFNQFAVILHTLIGGLMLWAVGWFVWRHWRVRRKGNLSHYQLLGYISLAFLVVCLASGLVLTWQGLVGPRMGYTWDVVHLVTGIGLAAFVLVHLATVVGRKLKPGERGETVLRARRRFYLNTSVGTGLLLGVCGLWAALYVDPSPLQAFPEDYNWRFGGDRPFAPSLARLDYSEWSDRVQGRVLELVGEADRPTYLAAFEELRREPVGLFTHVRRAAQGLDLDRERWDRLEGVFAEATRRMRSDGSVAPRALAGSERCGSSGCHSQVYEEWLPSAHRYSSLDDMFQRVQALMATETSPEHTRYCAGCHDPISLFGGAKDAGNITLSAEGANEGSSCIVCHSIMQADVQGNGDYTLRPPRRYAYELHEGAVARLASDFLIRVYPDEHLRSYSRPLYKTTEFCAACHKQYLDKEVNTDIGKVQGQNQYDSWKNSRWYHGDQSDKTIACRECHMPLVASTDPARGDASDYNRSVDDARHRSHSMVASNQYIPISQDLKGARKHVALVEKWLRGEVEIPEIADKWTDGPVVRMQIHVPEQARSGEEIRLQVVLTNNKTGHDFPTGPLDMIESWVELKVSDPQGRVLYHVGRLDESGRVSDPPLIYKADGFDRKGELIDRHNLWDLVGASYKRALYPGMTDTAQVRLHCPSLERGRVADADQEPGAGRREEQFRFAVPALSGAGELVVEAILWYRKANPDFLERVYGVESGVRSPATPMTRAQARIRVLPDVVASAR